MQKIEISIDGYKCFRRRHNFNLNNITLFTGANSAGKSSVIQSILLAKALSETATEDKDFASLSLRNNNYALDLGGYNDIINRDTKTGDINFSLFGIDYIVKGDDNDTDSKLVKFSISSENRANLRDFFKVGFAYLSADRMAPHFEYKESANSDTCDCHGTNVGDVFFKHQDNNAIPERSLEFDGDFKILMQLDEWCNYIFPGISVRVSKTGSTMYQLKVRNAAVTNVGFGITHALPILLSALLIPQGGMLIIENPEAHLHAKAQSNLGYFLARMAMAGVRVVIETHSEHIVNGIRRLVVEETSLNPEDVTIYFFKDIAGEMLIKEINLDAQGNLSEFPIDFFDQVRQDMLYLLKKGNKED